jgi:hypothetical protein
MGPREQAWEGPMGGPGRPKGPEGGPGRPGRAQWGPEEPGGMRGPVGRRSPIGRTGPGGWGVIMKEKFNIIYH